MSGGPELERLFWIVIVGLATVLSAIVLLVRSGRAVPAPGPDVRASRRTQAPSRPRHASVGPVAARSRP